MPLPKTDGVCNLGQPAKATLDHRLSTLEPVKACQFNVRLATNLLVVSCRMTSVCVCLVDLSGSGAFCARMCSTRTGLIVNDEPYQSHVIKQVTYKYGVSGSLTETEDGLGATATSGIE